MSEKDEWHDELWDGFANELRSRARIHEDKGSFSITPAAGRWIADKLDELADAQAEHEQQVRDAKVSAYLAGLEDAHSVTSRERNGTAVLASISIKGMIDRIRARSAKEQR